MRTVGVFISDRGNSYLPECQRTLGEQLFGHVEQWHTVDDSEHRLGMAGAVRAAWSWAREQDCDYLLHIEEDFLFPQPVHLEELQAILLEEPRLAQVVLKRQPWSNEEKAAGGIIEMHPSDYVERRHDSLRWTEHRRIFSLNPCLIPRKIIDLGWPDGNEAEFTERCLMSRYRFAFLGHKTDPPVVEHVGYTRGIGWRL